MLRFLLCACFVTASSLRSVGMLSSSPYSSPYNVDSGRCSSSGDTRLLAKSRGSSADDSAATAVQEANRRYLATIGVRSEACDILLSDGRMINITIKDREKALRESIGMSRDNLKQTLNNYPVLAIDILTDTYLKTSKYTVMRSLNITEDSDYDDALKKIQKQSNNRKGFVFFRGNVKFLISFLKKELGLELRDLQTLFKLYPTLFTMEERFLKSRIGFLLEEMHYTRDQLKKICIQNSRFLLYSESRFIDLRAYMLSELQLEAGQFCDVTSRFPRLLSVSLATIRAKASHLTDANAWGINRAELTRQVLIAPTILTTPTATTRDLYAYLNNVLGLAPPAVSTFIHKYPGFLRVNRKTVERNVDYVVLSEVVLILFMNGLLPIDASDVYSGNNCGEEMAASTPTFLNDNNIKLMYQNIAGQLLLTAGLSCTCSLERIADRVDRTADALLRANDVDNIARNVAYIKHGIFSTIKCRASRTVSDDGEVDSLKCSVQFIAKLIGKRCENSNEMTEKLNNVLFLWSLNVPSVFYTKPKNIALNEEAFLRTV